MSKLHRVIICIGSNVSPEENVCRAVKEVSNLLEQSVEFAEPMYTKSMGVSVSPTFLNIVAVGYTRTSYEDTRASIKQIEALMGRKKEDKETGRIPIDIDILQWDDKVLKPADLNYSFVKESLAFLNKSRK